MRNYTQLDLLRFHRFASEPENAGKDGITLIREYKEKYPEKPLAERWENMCNALGLAPDHPLRKRIVTEK